MIDAVAGKTEVYAPVPQPKSAVWLTIKESWASFAIEHEEQHVDRVRRFASSMEQRMTDHVEYLAQMVRTTIEQMRKEAGYLRSLRTARERVKEVMEGPDGDIDRIIRSVRENGGRCRTSC